MTCAELRARLDAYARDALSRSEASRFEEHLNGCAECQAFLEAAEPRLARTESLARQIEPAPDLWPGIRSRLLPRGAGSRRRFLVPAWMLAAAAVLIVAVSSGVTFFLSRGPASGPAASASIRAAELEAQYASAAADLALALEAARTRLAPATVATIERNLAVIDSALAESRRALAGDPGNATLEQLVVAAWRQKVEFLRRATALTTEL